MNLLYEDLLSEVYVVFPKNGEPRLFATKPEGFSQADAQRVCMGLINAAIHFGLQYGVQIHGTLGSGVPPPPPPTGTAPA